MIIHDEARKLLNIVAVTPPTINAIEEAKLDIYINQQEQKEIEFQKTNEVMKRFLELLKHGHFYVKTRKLYTIRPFGVTESSQYINGYNKGIIDVLREIENFIEGDLNL